MKEKVGSQEKYNKRQYNDEGNKDKPKKRKFICIVCIKSFAKIKRFIRHTCTVHTNERSYKCDECPKSYKQP